MTALPSKVGNNNNAATRKRAALGDVTNAHKKIGGALGDITNAVLKKETTEKVAGVRRPVSRKTSTTNVKKSVLESKPLASKQLNVLAESKPLVSKQTITTTTTTSVVIPKKRPSEAVVGPPRRTLTQSNSKSSLVQKSRVAPRRHVEELPEPGAPRKKQKVEQKPDWDDLDAADANDPLMVSEYVVEIFNYMRELEVLPPLLRESHSNDRLKQCQIQHI